MTKTVLSWLSCSKFAAVHDWISKMQFKKALLGPVSPGDTVMYCCISSATVKADAVPTDDIPKGKHVNIKKNWT